LAAEEEEEEEEEDEGDGEEEKEKEEEAFVVPVSLRMFAPTAITLYPFSLVCIELFTAAPAACAYLRGESNTRLPNALIVLVSENSPESTTIFIPTEKSV